MSGKGLMCATVEQFAWMTDNDQTICTVCNKQIFSGGHLLVKGPALFIGHTGECWETIAAAWNLPKDEKTRNFINSKHD